MIANTSDSSFTQRLLRYQQDFHQHHSSFVMREVVGRVVTIAVLALLHAEWLCRMITYAFSAVHTLFSKVKVLENGQNLEWSKSALKGSLYSFQALWNRKVLDSKTSEKAKLPKVKIEMPSQNPKATRDESQGKRCRNSLPDLEIDRFYEADSSRSNTPSTPSSAQRGNSVIGTPFDTDEENASIAQTFEAISASLDRSSELCRKVIPLSDESGHTSADDYQILTPPRNLNDADISPLDHSPFDVCDPDSSDAESLPVEGIHSTAPIAKLLKLTEDEVRELLNCESTQANSEVNHEKTEIHFVDVSLFKDIIQDGGVIGKYAINTCQSSKKSVEYLWEEFTFNGDQNCTCIGMFDPNKNSKAAGFLKAHLGDALKENLKELSLCGIFEGITAAFEQLHSSFLRQEGENDPGCSAVIVLEVDRALWVCSLGTSKVMMKNGDGSLQCTSKMALHCGFGSNQRSSVPRVTRYDTVEDKSCIVLANSTISAHLEAPTIAKWLSRPEKLLNPARTIAQSVAACPGAQDFACLVIDLAKKQVIEDDRKSNGSDGSWEEI